MGARGSFAPGDVLAERFEIVRFVARGGMGDVYQALDLELGTGVALKAIRAEIADDERVVRRFQREIVLARQVTHPNVCRLFDLYRHRGPGTPPDGVLLLAMEFVSGETLLTGLRRGGPLAPEALLPLARQMAAGLQAAHDAGVVHRDFKSSNVIVTPDASRGNPRLVITDFGLACHFQGELSSLDAGALIGTSTYMAPEQVQGGPITPAVDVYAFGVVLYELLTGVPPFEGDTALAVALRRLEQPPTPPRAHRPDLDPLWEAVLLRCLEREPARRFARIDAVVAALEREPRAALPPRPRHRRLLVAAGLAALLGLLLAWRASVRVPVAPTPSPTASPTAARRTHPSPRRALAVLAFRDLAGRQEDAWIGIALAELLATDVAAGGEWRAVPGAAVAALGPKPTPGAPLGAFALDTLMRSRRVLAADVLVSGAYLRFGASGRALRVDLRVQDTLTGEELVTLAERGSADDLPDLSARVAVALRTRLGAQPALVARAADGRGDALPRNLDAARSYARAIERMRAYDWAAATELLQQVVARDQKHAPTWLALYESWAELGYERKARAAAQRAFDLSNGLPFDERVRIVGAYHTAMHEHGQAAASYRLLSEHDPENLGYGLLLARSCVRAGSAREALDVLARLRRLPAPQGGHPEIDVVEALAAQALSDFKQQRAAARRAAAAAEGLGADSLVAEARYLEGWAELKLGSVNAAVKAFDEARARFQATGNTVARALVLSSMGVAARAEGQLEAALRDQEAAFECLRRAGHQHGAASTAMNIGVLLEALGQPRVARQRYQQARAVQREIGDRAGLLRTLVKLGALELAAGDVSAADATCDEAMQGARDMIEPSLVALSLACAGDVRLARDDLAGASGRYREALELGERTGERVSTALMRLALATTALEAGQHAAAAAAASAAERELGQSQRRDDQVRAAAVAVRAQLSLGQPAAARETARRAEALARQSQRLDTRLTVLLVGARVALAEGRHQPARAALLSVIQQARQAGDLSSEREARLALAEVEIAQGRRTEGCAQALALQRSASATGLDLLARRARLAACDGLRSRAPAQSATPTAAPGAQSRPRGSAAETPHTTSTELPDPGAHARTRTAASSDVAPRARLARGLAQPGV